MASKIWSEEDTKTLYEMYEKEPDDIELIARHFDKSPRQIIAKLSSMRVYKKQEPALRSGHKTVKMLFVELERLLDIRFDIANLNRKENLEKLVDRLQERLKEDKC